MTALIDWLWKAFFYLGIQVADRIPRKVVPVREALTGPSAEESERPAGGGIFDQIKPYIGAKTHDLVTPDRPTELWFASPADKLGFALAAARARVLMEKRDLEAKRDRAVAEDIEELLGRVNYEDPRG